MTAQVALTSQISDGKEDQDKDDAWKQMVGGQDEHGEMTN